MTFKKIKLLGCSQVKPNSFLSPSSFRSLASILMVSSTIALPGFAQAQVSVYKHCNKGDLLARIPEGKYALSDLKNLSDDDSKWHNRLELKGNDVSAIEVPDGYKATLYANKDFTGRKLTTTKDIGCLIDHNFNDMMSSIKVELTATPTFSTPLKNVDEVFFAEDETYLKQVSVGKNKAWVWTKSSGDQVFYYENNRSASAINLQDANTRASAKIDLRQKRFTAANGHVVEIIGTRDRTDSLSDMHVIEVKNKIIAAYYADREYVYGLDANPDCSMPIGVDGAYQTLFEPACEVHDRYYNAPWEFILNETWTYDFNGQDSADGNSALVKDIVESTFRDDMEDICNDLGILSQPLCHTTKFTWYNALRDSGDFYSNQKKLRDHDQYYTKDIVYRMPKAEMIEWMEKANEDVEIRGGGTEFEVEIDCNVTGVGSEDTNDTITVEFFNKSDRSIGSKSSNGVTDCLADTSFTASLNEEPTYFKVSTTGHDGYMIDEFVVRKNGKGIGRLGVDNDKGWCLSTDPNDANGEWKNHVAGKCQKTFEFSMAELNTKLNYSIQIDCIVDGADDEETSDRVKVEWYSADGRSLGADYKHGISTCHGSNEEFKAELTEPASYVKVSINGDNGFLMDEVQMYVGERQVLVHGKSATRGWCLSTDNTDHNKGNFNGHSYDSQCPSERRFNYP